MHYDEEIGRRVRLAREHRGIGQSELARMMRSADHATITPGRMFEIEHGQRGIRAEEVRSLCRILRVPAWWILGMSADEKFDPPDSGSI